MNAYVRLVYRNLRANLDKASLFFELIFPLFFIFVQGYGLGGIAGPVDLGNGKSVHYQLYLAAGAVTLTVMLTNGAGGKLSMVAKRTFVIVGEGSERRWLERRQRRSRGDNCKSDGRAAISRPGFCRR